MVGRVTSGAQFIKDFTSNDGYSFVTYVKIDVISCVIKLTYLEFINYVSELHFRNVYLIYGFINFFH